MPKYRLYMDGEDVGVFTTAIGDEFVIGDRNRFRIDDYVASAALYRRLRPEIVVTGHWQPLEVTDAYLDRIEADGRRLAELHRELLPLDDVDFGAEGFGARISPYHSAVAAGETLELEVEVKNPFAAAANKRSPGSWTPWNTTGTMSSEPTKYRHVVLLRPQRSARVPNTR